MAAEQTYQEFLASKRMVAPQVGPAVANLSVHPSLFPFQAALVRWAVRKGRCALFADTGLGKTRTQLEWARLLGERTLILAPLGVARQTVREGAAIGLDVTYARSQEQVIGTITVTNYEMLDHFDAAAFGAVVLDESSILKSLSGSTRQKLTALFAQTPYRLACTATPAPNDIAEIANHAEFLGVMRRVDMLASFFVHDDQGWRLKGHAHEPFYRWLASWGMVVRMPSDIGYPDDGYVLPALTVEPVWVEGEYVPDGQLFFTELKGIGDRAAVRRGTMSERVGAAAGLVNADGDHWICWCGLNDESSALAAAIPGAVEIAGTESAESKSRKIDDFQQGHYRVLVTKPTVAGFGVNFQHCARMVFVGLSDSWESYYQCIRRCYRFGQQRPVHAYVVLSQMEDAIYHNVKRKEEEAESMRGAVLEHVRDFERQELEAAEVERFDCVQDEATGEHWRLLLGDSVERMGELADNSVDLTVTSPPFQALYTYNPTVRDVGNARSAEEFGRHFGFIIDHLLRVTKPGRHCCIHVAQVPAMLERDGYIGLKDFRGDVVRLFYERGFIYHGEVCIDKDPQVQAIRTKSKGLLFVQMRKDASWSRPALADYILVFRKPGENAVPVHPDISNEQWIMWARPVWYDIAETDTLQYTTARDADDERHICPLQLGIIERCIRLWSNPGEMVLDPFAGIASVPWVALHQGRQAMGLELKRSYYGVGVKNLRAAEEALHRPTLFDGLAGWAATGSTDGAAR